MPVIVVRKQVTVYSKEIMPVANQNVSNLVKEIMPVTNARNNASVTTVRKLLKW